MMLASFHSAGAPFPSAPSMDPLMLQMDKKTARDKSLTASIPVTATSSSVVIWKWFVVLVLLAAVTLCMQSFIFMSRPPPVFPATRSNADDMYSFRGPANDFFEEFDCTSSLADDSFDEGELLPLLTLFTTMKDSPMRKGIQNATIFNWASLQPYVQPVLYIDKDPMEMAVTARELGWKTRQVPKYNKGVPIFRSMFLDAINTFNTPYYAFANADILFDESLIDTLRSMYDMNITDDNFGRTGDESKHNVSLDTASSMNHGLLIIGRRTNVNVTDLAEGRKLREIAREKGTMFITNAEDYFITTKNGLPWSLIPDLVIGRPGYDNWLVVKALDWHVAVVDASATLLAVHQTGSDGNSAGWTTNDGTVCINRDIAGAFDYRPGHTKCCLWVAQADIAGNIRVFKRNKISKDCVRSGHVIPDKDARCT